MSSVRSVVYDRDRLIFSSNPRKVTDSIWAAVRRGIQRAVRAVSSRQRKPERRKHRDQKNGQRIEHLSRILGETITW